LLFLFTQEALQKEVGMLTSLNHPNLVRFCGVCLDPPLLVMEYYRSCPPTLPLQVYLLLLPSLTEALQKEVGMLSFRA
jgi:serine/threonine protein kinase